MLPVAKLPTSSIEPSIGALNRLLVVALGDEERAADAVILALEAARRPTLPAAPRDLLAFVHAHLLADVTRALGPTLTEAFLADLAEEIGASDEQEPQPETRRAVSAKVGRPSVLLVDQDRMGRPALARALLRGGCDLQMAESLADVTQALAAPEPVHVVILDLEHTAIEAIVEAIIDARPDLPLIARGKDARSGKAFLTAAGAGRIESVARDAKAEELVLAVKQTVG